MKNIFLLPIVILLFASCEFGENKEATHANHHDSRPNHGAASEEFISPPQIVAGLKLEGAYYVIPGSGVKMAAAYGTITNTTSERVELRAVSAQFFMNLEIHQTIKKDGLSMMEPVEKLNVDAGESVRLKPGGMHFMLLNVQEEIEEGTPTQLVFQTAAGKTLNFSFPSK